MGDSQVSGRPAKIRPRLGVQAPVGWVRTMGARQVAQVDNIADLGDRQHSVVDSDIVDISRIMPVVQVVPRAHLDIEVFNRVNRIGIGIGPRVIHAVQVERRAALVRRVFPYRQRDMMPLARGQLRIILGVPAAGFDAHSVIAAVESEFHPVAGAGAAPADNLAIAPHRPFLLDPHRDAERRRVDTIANDALVAIHIEVRSGTVKIQGLAGVAGRKSGAVHKGTVAIITGRVEAIAVKFPPALEARLAGGG